MSVRSHYRVSRPDCNSRVSSQVGICAYRYHAGPAQHPADALVRPADYSKAWLHTFSA